MICIFTGPTLPRAEAAKILEAEYLPPAAIGDVYKAAQRRPWAIGIIDGFFESTPSVWHKEVLWAMARGIHVFGASSMGALRAAELAAFGMVGVGAIFEGYRDGTIEDDDEVAVVHGPPELGYVQLTEAMVNIRATVGKAIATDVVAPATGAALIEVAKSLYYKNRSYDRVLADASARRLPGDELIRLKAWLPKNQINQKRLDAIALLQAIKEAQAAAVAPEPASYVFEHTILWDAVERQFGAGDADDSPVAAAAPRNGIFDELRLDAKLHERLRNSATIRAFSRRVAEDEGVEPTMAELQVATRDFRKRMEFQSAADLETWLRDRDLSRDQFMRLMGDEARRQRLDVAHAAAIEDALVDELALADAHARLRSRADEKHAVLGARGLEQPTLEDAGLTEAELIAWFLDQCGRDPGDDDAEQLARTLGFIDKDDLLRAALREYCYRAWKDS
ncbi:MAG TPA: TfuA-like protein [Candidatus Angelobacter sp.]|nr:TfuA-like protein [Candidatus Angelobacter sp.]